MYDMIETVDNKLDIKLYKNKSWRGRNSVMPI